MVIGTEGLELLILISFKMNTEFSYWETLSIFGTIWICKSTVFNCKFYELKYRSNVLDEILGAKVRYAKSV